MQTQKLKKTSFSPQQFLKLCNNPRRIPPFLLEGFGMMWMQHLQHLCKMARYMSGCCELMAVCRRYGLSVRGNKVDVLARVVGHVASK